MSFNQFKPEAAHCLACMQQIIRPFPGHGNVAVLDSAVNPQV